MLSTNLSYLMQHLFLKKAGNYQYNLLYLLITQHLILFCYVILYFNESLQKIWRLLEKIKKRTAGELEESLNSDSKIFWGIFRKGYNKFWVRSVKDLTKLMCKTEGKLR